LSHTMAYLDILLQQVNGTHHQSKYSLHHPNGLIPQEPPRLPTHPPAHIPRKNNMGTLRCIRMRLYAPPHMNMSLSYSTQLTTKHLMF
jgi:hypothetical protein